MIDNQQTEIIKEFLANERFTDLSLIHDLTDHLSCEIEAQIDNKNISFEQAFEIAKRKIMPNEPIRVQQDLEFLNSKTQNIMIKKISYIGGYLSALVFSLAALFTVLSFQNESLVDSRRESMSEQYMATNLGKDLSKEETSDFYQDYYNETSTLKLKAINQSSISQILLIVSILLFGITYLPYRFYVSYTTGQLKLEH